MTGSKYKAVFHPRLTGSVSYNPLITSLSILGLEKSLSTKGFFFLTTSSFIYFYCCVFRYANVKKCSNEGRALMQLDFQQFLMKLEKLTDIRPIPDKEFVETYIKAYYLTENDMERWIKEHRVRAGKQSITFLFLFLCSVPLYNWYII